MTATYLDAAHARLMHALEKNQPPKFPIYPSSNDFDACKQHVEELTRAMDDYLHSIAIEVAANSTLPLNAKQYLNCTFEAVDGYLLYDIERAGERCREDALEAAE